MKILKVGPTTPGELSRFAFFLAGLLALNSILSFANGYNWPVYALGAVLSLILGVLAKRRQRIPGASLDQADNWTEG